MVVEPGVFRTDSLNTSSVQLTDQRISDYDGAPAHATLDWRDEANHTQLGEPVKGAAFIHRLASGDELSLHLPIRQGALDQCAVMIERGTTPWRDASADTGHIDDQ